MSAGDDRDPKGASIDELEALMAEHNIKLLWTEDTADFEPPDGFHFADGYHFHVRGIDLQDRHEDPREVTRRQWQASCNRFAKELLGSGELAYWLPLEVCPGEECVEANA